MYSPGPEHRRAWTGDANVLVATAIGDHDIPVAFDPRGHRILLDPARPPATPVIALVPVETDFTPPPALRLCDEDCGGGGSPPAPPPPPPAGLYMTQAHFVDDFEGWLKGAPEFEVHVLGQQGQTDSLTAGNDSTSQTGKYWKLAQALQKLWSALASLINTNDELVGNAVQDAVVGEYYAGFNWIVKGEDNVTNGWIKLELR